MTTTRVDPNDVPSSLKEAVVDSLLNILYARISGAGEFGRVLYGAQPRNLLSSGFLLPARLDVEGDEVTSPIWVSGHGCDLQITREGTGDLRLQPQFSLYVRVLPTSEDVKRPDCRPNFRLKREVALRIRQRRRELLDKRWDEIKGAYTSRSKHPDWLKITEEVRRQVHTEEGVPLDLAQVGLPESQEPSDSDDEDESAALIPGGGGSIPARDEHFEPLSIPHKWLRLEVDIPELAYPAYADAGARLNAIAAHEQAMHAAIEHRLNEWLASADPETGGLQWAFRRDVMIKPSQYRNWSRFLEELRATAGRYVRPSITPRWDIRVANDWLDPDRLNVHIALENRSEEPKQHKDETDCGLFQVSLSIGLSQGIHRPLRLERVEPSYRYNRFLDYPAMGFNGGVQLDESSGGLIQLRTTWAPRYAQPRMIAIEHKGVERNIRRLCEPDSFPGIEAIPLRMREWLSGLPDAVDLGAGLSAQDEEGRERERHKFEEDRRRWNAEVNAIEAGLRILRESKASWEKRGSQDKAEAFPFEAWLAMNEAVADLMRDRFGTDHAEWRLFQLAFILANLPTIASRTPAFASHFRPERDDAVTLLYFPTGGGKSEAFFGLLLFALFFDRLRGKGIGVTAMIRYPLRLLTIQQAQRISRVLAKAELVRRRRQYGGTPFSIGFWVGSGGSPNRLNGRGVSEIPAISDVDAASSVEDRLADENETYGRLRVAWRKLPQCPFCGSPTALRRFPKEGGTLAHVCTNKTCAANEGSYRPLPFYICDEDVYDFAPSVVLGTVDKLALIGHSPPTIRRVLGMFGAAPWRSLETGRLRIPTTDELRAGLTAKKCEGLFPAYADGIKAWVDPFPALLIQDEAHLLDESLGTFAGLFESMLDAIFGCLSTSLKEVLPRTPDGTRRRAKVVAASATVAQPERQLEHLYQRHSPAIQFPHPGPDLYHSFYAAPAPADEVDRREIPDVEKASKIGRIYAGFMTNGRPHTATSVAVLSNFHLVISQLFGWLVAGDDSEVKRAQEMLRRHLSVGTLRHSYDAYLARASAGELATLVDLHRIALTYVTNKKGGDQIMAAEAEETRKCHVDEGIEFSNLGTRLITGSVDQGEIQDVVTTAQTRPRPGEDFPKLDDALRSIIATSAVSHGVDVEELNSMFFAGLPSDVAEYIQASSRVGRTHVGFCLLMPTPQRRRDRYVVEVFDEFHRFLERMVQPAAIDRWAERAVERVVPSLFQGYMCGVLPSQALIAACPDSKLQVRSNETVGDIMRSYLPDQLGFVRGLMGFIENAIGLDSNFAPDEHAAVYYRNQLERRIRHLLDLLSESSYRTGDVTGFFRNQREIMLKPMTSLRDVDEPGFIHLADRDDHQKRLDEARASEVMAFICNGSAEMGDLHD